MKRFIITTAVTVALIMPFAQPAAARHYGAAPAHGSSPTVPLGFDPAVSFCADELSNPSESYVVSQNYLSKKANGYDSRAADDFTLADDCTVSEVRVAGYYSAGVASSVDVKFYADAAGTPGAVLNHQGDLVYVDDGDTGDLSITLPSPVMFTSGTYWISVQVNMAGSARNAWYWRTNDSATGSRARWKNPPNGFDTGCRRYRDMWNCHGKDPRLGTDLTFALVE